MKQLLLNAALFVSSFGCAYAEINALRVEMNSGATQTFVFNETTTFQHYFNKQQQTMLLAIRNNDAVTEIPVWEVKKADFCEVETSVQFPEAEDSFLFRFVDGETIQVNGAQSIIVSGVGGNLVSSMSPAGAEATLSLKEQPSGLYLVTINNKRTIKIMKR